MEKEFIPYEQALELKELEFNEECFGIYYNPTQELFIGKTVNPFTKEIRTFAPTYSQAFRWFDENTDFQGCVIDSINECHFDWEIINLDTEERIECEEYYSTRQEAELACLKKLIELVKNK
jgi:hypothetical protein